MNQVAASWTPLDRLYDLFDSTTTMFSMTVSTVNVSNPKVVVTPSSPVRVDAEQDAVDEIEDIVARFSTLFKIVTLLGGVPISKTDNGWQFSVCTRVFVYSVLLYSSLLVLFVHVITVLFTSNSQFSGSRSDFHRSVFNHMCIGLLALYLPVPVTAWLDAKGVAAYLNEWTEFQKLFIRTTGHRLRLKDTHREQLLFTFGIVAVVCAALILYAPPELRTWQKLPHLVSLVFSALICLYWMLCCDAVVDASDQLNAQLAKAMRSSESKRRHLYGYRRLWLALSRLTSNTSASSARTASVFTLTEIYLILLAVYGLLSCLLGTYPSSEAVVPYLIATFFTVAAFYVFCDMGYRVTEKVQRGILEELQQINAADFDCTTAQEVSLFFQCIAANPPVLSLGGFATINRDLFKSCCAAIFTYLVVVIQFEIGLNLSDYGDTDAPANAS